MFNLTAHGNVGKDPQIKYLEDNQMVANFSIAVRTGKDHTTWMNCVVWGKRAQTVADFIRKGSKITIVGQAKLDSYSKDGEKKQSLNVNVSDFTLPPRQNDAVEAEVPF